MSSNKEPTELEQKIFIRNHYEKYKYAKLGIINYFYCSFEPNSNEFFKFISNLNLNQKQT